MAIEPVPGQGYGGRQEQERAIMPNRGPATPAGPTPPPSGVPGVPAPAGGGGGVPVQVPPAGLPLPDVFGATERPGESPSTLPQGPPTDTQALLRSMYQVYPSPHIMALIEEVAATPATGGGPAQQTAPATAPQIPIGLPALEDIAAAPEATAPAPEGVGEFAEAATTAAAPPQEVL